MIKGRAPVMGQSSVAPDMMHLEGHHVYEILAQNAQPNIIMRKHQTNSN